MRCFPKDCQESSEVRKVIIPNNPICNVVLRMYKLAVGRNHGMCTLFSGLFSENQYSMGCMRYTAYNNTEILFIHV